MAHGHARIFAGKLGLGLGLGLDGRNGHGSSHDMHKRRCTNSALCSLESNEFRFCLDSVVSRYSGVLRMCLRGSSVGDFVDLFPVLIV